MADALIALLLLVSAGDYDRTDALVALPCRLADLGLKAEDIGKVHFRLSEPGSKELSLGLAQWDDGGDPKAEQGHLIFRVPGTLRKGTTWKAGLVIGRGELPVHEGGLNLHIEQGRSVGLYFATSPILRYNFGTMTQFSDKPSKFDRAGYFHPIWAPCGEPITGDFHPDHAHHRGLWFAWVKAQAGPVNANFWEIQEGRGKTVNKGLSTLSGPVVAGFTAQNECVSGDKALLKETVTTRVWWSIPGPCFVDLTVRQEVTDADVVLGKMHYGGLGFRGRSEWNEKGAPVEVLTSEGKSRRDANGTPARWADFAGPLPGGKWGGLLLIEHPSNPRYPNRLRVHPTMPFLSTTLVAAEPYTIKQGEPLLLRYRLVLHDGKADRELAERLAADFASPPKAILSRP